VQSVQPGGPAEKAGIKTGEIQAQLQGAGTGNQVVLGGDIITKVDGKTITSSDALSQMVTAHKPGDKMSLEIVRKGGKKTTVQVTLTTRPSQLSTG
jgi:putative serine protease PepD